MPTLLIIDDSPASRAEVRHALERDGCFDRVLEADDGLAGLRMLLEQSIDVVLCDLEMPGLAGEKLLSWKDSQGAASNVPFLFMTASANLERRMRLLEDGAADAIAKPFHARELVARLRLHLKIKQLQDELVVKNERLEHLSSTDSLTGLCTRRRIGESLEAEMARARRYSSPVSLLMADLDHFKEVNDSYGHPAGDAVLVAVTERLLAQLRVNDSAARYGGEEFLIVLPHNDLAGAVVAAQRWCDRVAEAPIVIADGREIHVTLSIGVAEFAPTFESIDDWVSAADTALYRAKANGRNCVEPFES